MDQIAFRPTHSVSVSHVHTSVRHFLHHHCHHPLLLLSSTTGSKLIFSTNPFLHSSTFPRIGLTPRTPASGAGSKLGLVWRVSHSHHCILLDFSSLPFLPSLSVPLLPFPLFIPLPSSLLSFSLSLSFSNSLHPSPFLSSKTPLFQLGSLRSAISSLSGVWGGAPAEIDFGAFLQRVRIARNAERCTS